MRKNAGFTIVEITIVVLVIAILVAITVVSYNGAQNRAYESSVRKDLTDIAKQMELYKNYSDNNTYPIAIGSGVQRDELETMDVKVSTSAYSTAVNTNLTYFSNTDGSDYVVMAIPKNGPTLFVRGGDSRIQTYIGPPSYPNGGQVNMMIAAGLTGTFQEATAAYIQSTGGWRYWY